MKPKNISENFCVTPQLRKEDVARCLELGYGKIINNRPDGEQFGQPRASELEAACMECGIEYVHIPVRPGQIDPQSVARFAAEITECDKPTIAFCKTGTRALILWALTQSDIHELDDVMNIASGAGYDLSKMKPALEEVYARRKSG